MRCLPTRLLGCSAIVGAIGSAMRLAALASPLETKLAKSPELDLMPLPVAPAEVGRQPHVESGGKPKPDAPAGGATPS